MALSLISGGVERSCDTCKYQYGDGVGCQWYEPSDVHPDGCDMWAPHDISERIKERKGRSDTWKSC